MRASGDDELGEFGMNPKILETAQQRWQKVLVRNRPRLVIDGNSGGAAASKVRQVSLAHGRIQSRAHNAQWVRSWWCVLGHDHLGIQVVGKAEAQFPLAVG
jgi:hypothetical protein